MAKSGISDSPGGLLVLLICLTRGTSIIQMSDAWNDSLKVAYDGVTKDTVVSMETRMKVTDNQSY